MAYPKREDYEPPKNVIDEILRRGRAEEPKVNKGPLYTFAILIIFGAISVVSAMIAGNALQTEPDGSTRMFVLLVGPMVTAWLLTFMVEFFVGFLLGIPGALVWGVTYYLYGSDSALWLFITALSCTIAFGTLTARYA